MSDRDKLIHTAYDIACQQLHEESSVTDTEALEAIIGYLGEVLDTTDTLCDANETLYMENHMLKEVMKVMKNKVYVELVDKQFLFHIITNGIRSDVVIESATSANTMVDILILNGYQQMNKEEYLHGNT